MIDNNNGKYFHLCRCQHGIVVPNGLEMELKNMTKYSLLLFALSSNNIAINYVHKGSASVNLKSNTHMYTSAVAG